MQGSRTRPRRVTLLPRQWNDLEEKKKYSNTFLQL